MSAYIGSVVFDYPLQWLDKGAPRVLGSDTVTRSGNVVMLRGESTSQDELPAKLRFEWTPWSDVETLYSYWSAGSTYSADFEDTGDTVTIRFAAKDGVANVKHQAYGDAVVHAHVEGHETDLYTGELNVFIIS